MRLAFLQKGENALLVTPGPTSTFTAVHTHTSTPTHTFTPGPTSTFTSMRTPTRTPTPTFTIARTATPTPTALPCTGDCDAAQIVTVDELVRGVRILRQLSEPSLLDGDEHPDTCSCESDNPYNRPRRAARSDASTLAPRPGIAFAYSFLTTTSAMRRTLCDVLET